MTQTAIGHPHIRLRRLRSSGTLRQMVREYELKKSSLIVPLFVSETATAREPILSLPGIERIPLNQLAAEVKELSSLGASSVLLFPVVSLNKKDLFGTESQNPQGALQQAIGIVKSAAPQMVVFADVALDPFTTHGHDGIVDATTHDVANDPTVEALCRMAVSLAQAGVDFVAPSDMMDGRIGAIRHALDAATYQKVGILAYSAKFASAFYGPFREAIASGSRGLNKRSYQIEYHNTRQALHEAQLDLAEGADMLMVKPALCYLDILAKIRGVASCPLVAYHVSGEYSMLKAAVANGWLDEGAVVEETLTSIFRAGADLIVTYYAKWALQNLF